MWRAQDFFSFKNEWIAIAETIMIPPWRVSTLGCSLIMSQTQIGPIIVSSKKKRFTSAAGMNLGAIVTKTKGIATHKIHIKGTINKSLLVRIKLELKKDGTILNSEILDHERMNRPGQKFYKVLAESALRAVRMCQPLKVPPTGYDKWKDLQLNFNPEEMLKG